MRFVEAVSGTVDTEEDPIIHLASDKTSVANCVPMIRQVFVLAVFDLAEKLEDNRLMLWIC